MRSEGISAFSWSSSSIYLRTVGPKARLIRFPCNVDQCMGLSDLKAHDLMPLPSIEKENYVTVYMTITQNRNSDFVYIGSTRCWKKKKVLLASRVAWHDGKEMAVEGVITSFKLLISRVSTTSVEGASRSEQPGKHRF